MSSGRLLELLRRASSSLALGVTDHAGRGLVARQPVQQGAVILSEVPLAAAPAPQHRGKVCYDCLRVSALAQPSLDVGGQAYCSAECADRAGGSYAAVEGPGGANFAGLVAYCTAHHERFPLLAARLACGIVQNGRSPAFEDLRLLCFANVGLPPPEPWAEVHELIQAGLRAHASALPPGSRQRRDAEERAGHISLEWLLSVMSHLHVNAFRVDCVFPLPEGRSLADMAAAIVGGSSDGHSGSAAYLLCSLFNHSCMPNVDVAFPDNSCRVEMRAARDIDRGEELQISYIDSNMPFARRQQQLQFAYGFECKCPSCVAQEDVVGGDELQ